MSLFKQFSWDMLLSQQTDLSTICTTSYVQSILPTPASVEGLALLPDTVTTNPVMNHSIPASWQTPGQNSIDFCNVTVSYTHPGTVDKVNLWFWLPSPESFKNRFLANGGGGFAITTAERSLGAGLVYGAVTGTTDGGFGSWTAQVVDVLLYGNGSLNYNAVHFYGYRATHEMSIIDKLLTSNFYSGPEAVAAPKAAHKYFPPNCELSRITRDAIDACDALDGRIDGVATDSSSNSFDRPASPAIEGAVSEKAAAIVADLWRGLHDKHTGKPLFVYFPPSASLVDASTSYNEETGQYEPAVLYLGVQYVNMFLYELQDRGPTLPLSIANITVDTLRTWILQGIQKFGQALETNWPELSPFRAAGGKIIHWHGEADAAIPVGSSVLYHESVRKTMHPGLSYNASHDALAEWYRLFLVPGAGHCSPSADQANGPFPQTVLGSIIDWVENGINPTRLDATLFGSGVEEKLCSFPLRPLWTDDGKTQECVYDQASIDTWFPKPEGFPQPVY